MSTHKHAFGSADWLMGALANLVFATALLPYASPFPVKGMDVQLMATAVSTAVLMLLLVIAPRRLTLQKTDFIVLGCGLLTLFYVNFNTVTMDFAWVRSCGTILLGFPVYFAVRNLYRYVWPGTLVCITALYVAVLALQLTFPRLYLSIFSHFLSEIRWEPGGYRGPNGLCVEPSMFANMCILFVAMMYFFHRDFWRKNLKAALFVGFASGAMLLISQSATGFVVAAIVAIVSLILWKISLRLKVAIIVLVLAVGSIGAGLAATKTSRGADFVVAALKNPLIAVNDPSFGMRTAGTVLGVYNLSDAPLGTGNLGLTQKMAEKGWESTAIKSLWPDPMLRRYVADFVSFTIVESHPSGLGPMIQRMGLLALLILGTMVYLVRGFSEKWAVRIFIIALLLNSSFVISTLWLVIGSCAAVYAIQTTSSPGGAAPFLVRGGCANAISHEDAS